MTDDEQDFFNKSIGKLEKEIISLKKGYQAECHRADELEDSLQKSWQNENKLKKQLEIAIQALKDTERKLLTIDVSNLSSWDIDKLYNIMFHDGIIDKALEQIKELDK